MPRTALFIVRTDPRVSPRPAEAIRIAAGVGSWGKVEVSLVLWNAAVLSLSEFPDDLIDEDHFLRYLPIVGEWGREVYVERDSPHLADLGEAAVRWKSITAGELAALAASSDCILHF
jgi:hypothetical protein